MAQLIKQGCKHPGCPKLVVKGYCPEHTWKKKDTRKTRPSASARGYTGKWQAASIKFLRRHPYCVDPFRIHGASFVKATDVDHIIPHQGNMALFWDRGNWQPLCKLCHSKKTGIERHHAKEDAEAASRP